MAVGRGKPSSDSLRWRNEGICLGFLLFVRNCYSVALSGIARLEGQSSSDAR